jgi:mannosyl-3-phosphoglycerate synthase
MAIVVPVCGEETDTITSVLSYIPYNCSTIVVSNSKRYPIDRYNIEKSSINEYFKNCGRDIKIIHQRDPELGEAFQKVEYKKILDKKGFERNGKAEGMLIGVLLALKEEKDYIGFVDADNYFLGSIGEYIKDYAVGFNLTKNPYSMVRLSWKSKPNIKEGKFVFTESGRSSRVTNRYMNKLLSDKKGVDIECIETGNAGEHAISRSLIEKIPFASGYEVEPYELIYLFEEFGGVEENKKRKTGSVDIIQMKTVNPHLHKKGSEKHINKMIVGLLEQFITALSAEKS